MGDYGPDAGTTNADRGPQGCVEYNVINEPGNYGWPYCIRDNVPYNDYDFATSTSGAKFNCAAPVNNSPNNTGLTNLPPAQPAPRVDGLHASATRGFPDLGTGGAPMGGPRYHFDPTTRADRSSRRSTTTSGSSASGTTAGSRPSTSNGRRPARRDVGPFDASAPATSARWTWTSAPTARST